MFDGLKALKRVKQLEEDFEKLKRDMRALEAEAIDLFERSKRLMGRISKRTEYLAQKDAQDALGSPPAEGNGPLPYPHVDPVSQRILARRKGIPILYATKKEEK